MVKNNPLLLNMHDGFMACNLSGIGNKQQLQLIGKINTEQLTNLLPTVGCSSDAFISRLISVL